MRQVHFAASLPLPAQCGSPSQPKWTPDLYPRPTLQDAVSSGGPLLAILAFCILPLVWSVPEALITAELATAFPENSGYVAWVTAAFGPFWGFQVRRIGLGASLHPGNSMGPHHSWYRVKAPNTAIHIWSGNSLQARLGRGGGAPAQAGVSGAGAFGGAGKQGRCLPACYATLVASGAPGSACHAR